MICQIRDNPEIAGNQERVEERHVCGMSPKDNPRPRADLEQDEEQGRPHPGLDESIRLPSRQVQHVQRIEDEQSRHDAVPHLDVRLERPDVLATYRPAHARIRRAEVTDISTRVDDDHRIDRQAVKVNLQPFGDGPMYAFSFEQENRQNEKRRERDERDAEVERENRVRLLPDDGTGADDGLDEHKDEREEREHFDVIAVLDDRERPNRQCDDEESFDAGDDTVTVLDHRLDARVRRNQFPVAERPVCTAPVAGVGLRHGSTHDENEHHPERDEC